MMIVPTDLASRARSNLQQLLERVGRILQATIGAKDINLLAIRVQPQSRRRR